MRGCTVIGTIDNKSTIYTITCRICGNKIKMGNPSYKYCNVCRRNK